MFNFNGMPYKRSGRAGGKSVSTIGMLVLLLAALLLLPSCFDDDDDGVSITCGDGTMANADGMCVPTADPLTCGDGTMANADGMCRADFNYYMWRWYDGQCRWYVRADFNYYMWRWYDGQCRWYVRGNCWMWR